ncbi:MAG: peptide ABC transporter substrate-binding protein, partial [Verrucomicrobiae bacterium]|nr:peptide ABC transporter substrate-binding protein [Verrucomicrobiae bacterium]
MYLGQVMEIGSARDVIENPWHPYTRALISAVAVPDPRIKRPPIDIRGDIAMPIDPPPGCRFAARCPHVMDVCRQDRPPMVAVGDGHHAACHLFSGDAEIGPAGKGTIGAGEEMV